MQCRDECHEIDDVSFSVEKGAVAIVSESGSGQTILARCFTRLIEPDSGNSEFFRSKNWHCFRFRILGSQIQMVFQDPYTSLNPRMIIGAAIIETGRVLGTLVSAKERYFVGALLELVGLARSFSSQPSALVADKDNVLLLSVRLL